MQGLGQNVCTQGLGVVGSRKKGGEAGRSLLMFDKFLGFSKRVSMSICIFINEATLHEKQNHKLGSCSIVRCICPGLQRPFLLRWVNLVLLPCPFLTLALSHLLSPVIPPLRCLMFDFPDLYFYCCIQTLGLRFCCVPGRVGGWI